MALPREEIDFLLLSMTPRDAMLSCMPEHCAPEFDALLDYWDAPVPRIFAVQALSTPVTLELRAKRLGAVHSAAYFRLENMLRNLDVPVFSSAAALCNPSAYREHQRALLIYMLDHLAILKRAHCYHRVNEVYGLANSMDQAMKDPSYARECLFVLTQMPPYLKIAGVLTAWLRIGSEAG